MMEKEVTLSINLEWIDFWLLWSSLKQFELFLAVFHAKYSQRSAKQNVLKHETLIYQKRKEVQFIQLDSCAIHEWKLVFSWMEFTIKLTFQFSQ